MCLGQNSAHHAVHYLNSQLRSLYENSVECVKHAGSGLKPLERVRYDFALAEFHVGARQQTKFALKDDMMFSAVFGKPRLEFICNHEAILYLKIKEGHFNSEIAKADSSAFVPNRSRHVKLHDMEVAFRVSFDVQGIRGYATKIGNGFHVIQLMVLNFQGARLVSKVNAGDREGIQFYMRKYLDYLYHTSHHILFSLPDFDDDRLDMIIDYSLESHINRTLDTEIHEVFGVSVEEINRSLSSQWLKAIMDVADGADRNSICLAEYSSTWTTIGKRSDIQFHIKFGAPRVRVLCKCEAVLYFRIEELLVSEGHDFTVTPKHTYSDWEIAVVVDLTEKVGGSFKHVEIDMTTLRFCEHFSKFHGFDLTLDFATMIKTTVVKFITEYYAVVLETTHFHEIHTIDISRPPMTPEPGPWGRRGVMQGEIIMGTDMGHYDFIQVVSEQSIIEHFKVLWHLSRDSTAEYSKVLGKWSYSEDFKASFGALKIRYLSDEKVIVWIQLDEGTLKPLKGSTHFNFSDWSIAFEVKLKMVDQAELSKSWFTRFKESFAWKHHGSEEHRTFKHLVLDFTTSEFVYDLSKFEGLYLANRSAVENVRGAVHYLKDYYFRELIQYGHHVLQSVPIWKRGSNPPPTGLTDVTFQIYSKTSCTRHSHVSQHYDIVLILLGMTGFRPLPSGHLEYSTEWFTKHRGTVTHGTVCLSSKVFLEKRLLILLSRVNATTTIVPFFPGGESSGFVTLFDDHEGSEWDLALTTSARHPRKWTHGCNWKLESNHQWRHTDKWSYKHKGSIVDEHNGVYTIECQAKNYLRLPTTINHGSLDIVMGGKIDINLGFKGASTRWASEAVAEWSVTLSMVSPRGGSGLTIEVKGNTKPKFETSQVHGDASIEKLIDLKALHKLVVVDLDDLVTELRQLFGGVWEHCFPGMQAYSLSNPVFNSNGDILFELRPYVPPSQVIAPRPSHASSSRSTSSALVDGTSAGDRPVGPKKTKSILRRIGEGTAYAGQSIGDVIKDAFEGNPDDGVKETSSVHISTTPGSRSSTEIITRATSGGSVTETTKRVITTTTHTADHTPAIVPFTSTAQSATPNGGGKTTPKAEVKAGGKANGGTGVTLVDPVKQF
ncbi:hypothetical protein BD779DRAFT_1546677 [Infundibulicybe gibba]|nr:hypothetical protein BD779DRAFT_1546677 [Infundibulicybe gibba]